MRFRAENVSLIRFPGRKRITDTFSGRKRITDTFSDRKRISDTFSGQQRITDTFSARKHISDTFSDRKRISDLFSTRKRIRDTFSAQKHISDTFSGRKRITDTFSGRKRIIDAFSGRKRITDTFSSRKRITDMFSGRKCIILYFRKGIRFCRLPVFFLFTVASQNPWPRGTWPHNRSLWLKPLLQTTAVQIFLWQGCGTIRCGGFVSPSEDGTRWRRRIRSLLCGFVDVCTRKSNDHFGRVLWSRHRDGCIHCDG